MPVLAIDAGGSATRALLVDEAGGVLASARGGAANASAPEGQLAARLAALLGGMAAASVVLAGFAGAGREAGRLGAEAALRAAGLIGELRVTTDAHLAWLAVDPLARGPAAVILAGTGSIALAGTSLDHLSRAGGWGRQFGDQGGGFWLGRRVLEEALRFADGRRPEAGVLCREALGALGLADADALVGGAAALWDEPARVAALAPLAVRLAADGDRAAGALLREAASALAELLAAARGAADLPSGAPTGLAGGLWRGAPLREAFLRALPPGLARTCRPLPVPPVVGGACSALHRAAAARLVGAAQAGAAWVAAVS